jgi:hypothetical protein
MALKNNEEALLERISRATAKELKRLRRQHSHVIRNERADSARPLRDPGTLSADAYETDSSRGARQ